MEKTQKTRAQRLLGLFRSILGTGIISESIGSLLAAVAPYKYPELSCHERNESDSDEFDIRIMQVLSADEKGIECSLTLRSKFQDAKSQTTPKYYCLSYTWGDPVGSHIDYSTSMGVIERWFGPLLSLWRMARRAIRNFLQPKHYVISCGAGLLTVTPNLWNALIHLQKLRPQALQAIWVDAVCINQN